ncbi:MAG TPA: PEP-CTERM sorting domain-containing protein, partial [Tepidisphaeraceae bacterium]
SRAGAKPIAALSTGESLKPILFLSAALLAVPCVARAVVFSDNFDDNVTGPAWTQVIDDPSLTLAEQGGQLNVIANASNNPNNDALYLSNGPMGFRLATTADFSFRIDYSLGSPTPTSNTFGPEFGLVLGLGRDLEGTDSAAIGIGVIPFVNNTLLAGLKVGHRTDDVQVTDAQEAFVFATSGTFVISYDAAGDDLTLTTAGRTTPLFVLTDTVRGVWGAEDLLVSFGGRGNAFTTSSTSPSYLDNFVIDTGPLVPEPASLSLLGLAATALLARRRTK